MSLSFIRRPFGCQEEPKKRKAGVVRSGVFDVAMGQKETAKMGQVLVPDGFCMFLQIFVERVFKPSELVCLG